MRGREAGDTHNSDDEAGDDEAGDDEAGDTHDTEAEAGDTHDTEAGDTQGRGHPQFRIFLPLAASFSG